MIDLKFGKKTPETDKRDFKFAKYAKDVKIPTTFPKNFGYGTRFKNWGMLGNDEYGDCVIASRAHLTMLDTSVGAPTTARFTTASVLKTYSAVTGFDPADPSTDNGTDMRAMCKYQQKTGITDADGKKHTIGAYLALDPGNPLEAMQATYLFGGFGFGFEVPESAIEQFDNGLGIWTDVGDKNIIGGHEVCGVGTIDSKSRLTIVTWAIRFELDFNFLRTYNDESWVWVAPEILNTSGKWRGLDLVALNADLLAL